MRVGVLGAWSIDNSGDAIVGYATRRALRARLPGAEIIAFAPRFEGAQWSHDVTRARGIDGPITAVPVDDLAWARELDALVIGGGGIINFNPQFRSFLLGDTAWSGPPVAWNGVCSQNTPAYAATDEQRALVRRCCEHLAYASVRNTTTAKLVRACGYTGELHVVPDPAFEDLGLAPARPERFTIALSAGAALASPRAEEFFSTLFVELSRALRARSGELVLVPSGGVYGDATAHEQLATRLGARCVRPDSPLDVWRALGEAHVVLAARLHAVIAAISLGVPFLALDEYFSDQIASSKIRELLVELDLEAHYTCPLVSRNPAPKLAHVLGLAGEDRFGDLVAHQRRRLDAHWSAMIRALGLAC